MVQMHRTAEAASHTTWDSRTLMKIVLGRPLDFLPGTSQSYSNFGYLILSLIIEKVSGQSYEDFIQENVLRPAGCYDFHIAGNLRSDRRQNETCYFVPSNEPLIPKYDNSGEYVVRCYHIDDRFDGAEQQRKQFPVLRFEDIEAYLTLRNFARV